MNTIGSRRVRIGALATTFCSAAALAACADKGVMPPQRVSAKVALQITAYASQQQSAFGPHWVLIAAVYEVPRNNGGQGGSGTDFKPLAIKWVPYASGNLQVTLDVPLATCLADDSRLGAKDGCSLYVGAALLQDTFNLRDSTKKDPLAVAFDDNFPIGPFVVGAGRAPTIPPIDLSASHFGVIRWEPDEALRLGGDATPQAISGQLTGVIRSGGAVALILPTEGFLFPATPNQPPEGPRPQLAIFENGTWRRVTASSATTNAGGFTGVAAFAIDDAYAAHRSGLYHFDGSGFTRVPAVNDSLFAASAVSSAGGKLVIAGAGGGAVWIGNTLTWTRYSLGATQRIDAVCITGPNEAFAGSSFGGGLWRFDGSSWTSVPAPATSSKFALQCPAPGQAFVLSLGLGGGMFRWNGSVWVNVPFTGLNAGRLITWGVASPNEMYAYGDSALIDRAFYRFDGTSWTEVRRTRFVQSASFAVEAMWADPRGGGAYLVSPFGRVERVTPNGVTVLGYQPSLRDVSVSSANSAFAVGWNLFLARWDGAKWTVDPPPPGTPTVRILQGVWSDGPSNAWAVGGASTILRYNGTGWSVVSDVLRPVATADNYNAVWGNGSSVWIVGDKTVLRCGGAAGCVNETGSPGALYGIWGTSDASVKYAVGAGGKIVKSAGGGAWQAMTSPTSHTLVRVSGTSANDVWAVGDSVLIHYDGTAWTNVPMTGDLYYLQSRAPSQLQGVFQLGLWARSPDEVYLGGENGAIARYDGRTRTWSEMDFSMYRRRILAISGPAGGCALAVTEGQSDNPRPTLWRGIGPSGCFLNTMAPPTNWP